LVERREWRRSIKRTAAVEADERVLMGWLLGGGFFICGCLGLLVGVMPHYSLVDEAAVLRTSFAAILTALVIIALRRVLPPIAYRGLIVLALVAVTLGLNASGDPRTDTELMYLYPLLFAFYFFSWWEAAALWALAVTACAIVVSELDPGTPDAGILIFAVVTAVNCGIVGLLRDRSRRLVASVEGNARTDPLTGLLNRRGFQIETERAIIGTAAEGLPFALVVVDLDDFKGVNDRLGHLGGDMTLERVAAVISRSQRAGDVSARMGGEEFAVALPGASREQAMRIAERLREGIEEGLAGSPAPITSSVGVACLPDHGLTLEELLRAADFALYAAKDAGKNRTVLYDSGLRGTTQVPDRPPVFWTTPEQVEAGHLSEQ
jgi:diguanylate cyclase (GGDEF)-like protein